MALGKIKCIGTCQHLKGKFGGNYQIEVRCGVHKRDEIMKLCEMLIPEMSVDECYEGLFHTDYFN